MTSMKSVLLADRGVVRVRGPDALSLLQGLITNDMALLETQKAIHAGLLSPQGKILFDFFVVGSGETYLLETVRSMAGALVMRLSMYKLRADVVIEDVSRDYTVAALWGGVPEIPEDCDGVCYADPRLSVMGTRLLVTMASDWLPAELDAKASTHDDYDAHRIALCVPEGGKDYAFGDTFVHEALFDQIDGVSFTKGCFIGQEVVSRMQHRGTARRRIVGVEGDAHLPEKGSEVRAGSSLVGTLGSVSGTRGLAALRLDRAGDAMAAGTPLVADGVRVAVKLPEWARFTISGADGS